MIGGKRYTFVDGNKKTVLKRARMFAEEVEEAIKNPTFKDAMEQYIKDNEKLLSAATIRGYTSIQRRLIKDFPWFCSMHLVAIRSEHVQNIIMGLDRSVKTMRNYVGFIEVVCGRTFKIKLPAKELVPMNIPTDLEVAGLIQLFKDTELEIPILLAAYGPLRNAQNEWVTKQPKTYSSNRTIKLPHFVVEKVHEKGYITKYNAEQISQKFRRGQKKAGVEPYFNFHALRHYCVSTLHAQGIPDEYIMERGGWATPHVLQSVYRHTLSDKSVEMNTLAIEHFNSVTNFMTK